MTRGYGCYSSSASHTKSFTGYAKPSRFGHSPYVAAGEPLRSPIEAKEPELWSGRRESNADCELGKLLLYDCEARNPRNLLPVARRCVSDCRNQTNPGAGEG